MSAIDVGIVGAGPAGAWAAYRLARAGARVMLFDPSHPREKPCGGGVTGRALALVSEVVPQRRLKPVMIAGARFEAEPSPTSNPHAPARAARVPLSTFGETPESSLIVFSRAALDGALVGAAVESGARLVPERVVDISVASRRPEVRTSSRRYQCDLVLGADGATSLVRRRAVGAFSRSQLSIASGFFAGGRSATEIVIRCIAEPPGYLWSFPRHDHLAIGVCAQADSGTTAAALQLRTRAWMTEAGVDPTALVPYSWPIPSLRPQDFDTERAAGDRWMLLGDAAGLVDPLTREGIYFALQSGAWSAEALLRDPATAPREYVARLADEIYPELKRAAHLKHRFFHPAFTRLLVQALDRSAALRAVMADLVAGRQAYRGLRRRLIQTFEFDAAWRLLQLAVLSPKTCNE